MNTVSRRGRIETICKGTPGDEYHDWHSCPGGEWVTVMSLPWFADRPGEALAIWRGDPTYTSDQFRMVIVTEVILDL